MNWIDRVCRYRSYYYTQEGQLVMLDRHACRAAMCCHHCRKSEGLVRFLSPFLHCVLDGSTTDPERSADELESSGVPIPLVSLPHCLQLLSLPYDRCCLHRASYIIASCPE